MIQIPIEIGDVIRVGRFKNKRVKVKEITWDEYGLPLVNGKGILKIRIEKLMPQYQNIQENDMVNKNKLKEKIEPFQKDPIQVKVKKKDGKYCLYQQTINGEVVRGKDSYDTEEEAEYIALLRGFQVVDSNDKPKEQPTMNSTKLATPPKATKGDPVKHDKPKEVNLGKEKIIKLENLIRKVINEISSKKKAQLKEEINSKELEQKARRFAELAQKMKQLESELKQMELEFEQLDQELTPLVEQVGKVKDTFIRAGNVLIKIEREGYNRKSKSYKTGFDYLYNKVNATMKDLAEEALKMTETVSYVKSKISVVEEVNWLTKIKSFFTSKLKKIFGLNNQANKLLDELENQI